MVGMEEERSEGDMERAVEWIWVGFTFLFLATLVALHFTPVSESVIVSD